MVQDRRGKIIFVNDHAAKMSGFPDVASMVAVAPEALRRRFDFFDPRGVPLSVDQLPGRVALAGGGANHALVRYRTETSSEDRWTNLHANPIDDEHGAVRYVVSLFRDVTDERRNDEARRVAHEWHSTVLQAIGDAVITTDRDERVTFLNPVAEALTGWSTDAAAGRPLREVFHILDEETRQPSSSPVERSLAEGIVVGLANHTILVRRNGDELAIDDSAAPIREGDGSIAGCVLIFRDVSARRADEKRRLFLARAAAELNSSLDYQRTLATVARLAVPDIADWCAVDVVEPEGLTRVATAHIDPAKIVFVDELERRYPPDPNATTGVPNVLRTGQPEFVAAIPEAMLTQAAQDDEHRALILALGLHSYICVPLRRGAHIIGVVTLVQAESKRSYGEADLALALSLADRAAIAIENARLFREVERAKAEAERASRAKDEFLAMLGHELRNPLAPMLTALEMMALNEGGSASREVTIFGRQLRHMVRLVDDLLDVSRIASGKVQLRKDAVDVGAVLTKAVEMVMPLLVERRHTIDLQVHDGLVVSGDEVRLAQVYSNVIGNAAKYTPVGGRIEVEAQRHDGQIVVRVRDNGRGIAPEMLPRVFDLFAQEAQTAERSEGGLGLGLAIVRNLVVLHGGTVVAHSDGLDRGTEFVITLPAVAEPAVARTPVEGLPVIGIPSRPRVLLVDDNRDALELLAMALEAMGCEVVTAADGAEALEVAEATPPAVALLDIGLPGMDGYELGARLRALPALPALHLVALTGYGQASDVARSKEAGFTDHLVKPITLAAVREVIDRIWRERR